ncbi:hypothetical protein BOTBODRAFT_181640 [Botryobasidium botryosum FD-172 SS1]|uniref:Uncharacterized protein n=1 Tax=Botryobasidium botryosum (strain FD-172 SS1) TaxID=930990 RepID=A0A067M3H3_BOTB1|nr:hypothetical protein BOTBODRAFT_181640 [Botryobasidium botryosum FD-172 SS1]
MFMMASYLNSARTLAPLIALVAEVLLYGKTPALEAVRSQIKWPLHGDMFRYSSCASGSWSLKRSTKVEAYCTSYYGVHSIYDAHCVGHLSLHLFTESLSPKEGFLAQKYPVVILTYALYDALNFIGDGIVVYRCYVICDSRFRVVALPTMLLLAGTPMGVYSIASFAFGRNSFSLVTEKFSLTSYCSSFVLNVARTALTTYRIWTPTCMTPPLLGSRRTAKCYAVLIIIVESAAVYAVAMAVLIGTYAGHAPDAAQISSQVNAQIVCIVPTLILVHTGLSQKMGDDCEATHPQYNHIHALDWPEDRRLRSLATNDDDRPHTSRILGIFGNRALLSDPPSLALTLSGNSGAWALSIATTRDKRNFDFLVEIFE